MASAFFSPATVLRSSAASSSSQASAAPKPPTPSKSPFSKPHLAASILPFAAAAALAISPGPPPPSIAADSAFHIYYGTAASAANYGGYGGNSSKQDSAEYTYEVPDGWKERLVSKVEKGTNGTDSEFYNPKKRGEREYLTFLPGIRELAPVDSVLGNLALSDVGLQDQIAGSDSVRSEERRDAAGQVYYAYEIDGVGAHSLISVTCRRNKLYAHFVSAPAAEWSRDEATLRRLHESFKTVDPPFSSSSSFS
ncbi:Thylakoid lumenal 19 kDa protein, chloroplastic [Apostasia shenzhenica]|uniref:Thylakoid lumenal 19 kDa protein, chloroplastic n=1 Tax=Apostasia shenzhenica TaxID=1088818 RepID=A0A2I0AXU9_9ASPA|nr:Thylakoid lumenal 19 kDa protein, chloroplastic [Apostasia shenzhenica]